MDMILGLMLAFSLFLTPIGALLEGRTSFLAQSNVASGQHKRTPVEEQNAKFRFDDNGTYDEWRGIATNEEDQREDSTKKHWNCDSFEREDLQIKCRKWRNIHTVLKEYAERIEELEKKKETRGEVAAMDPLVDFEVPPVFLDQKKGGGGARRGEGGHEQQQQRAYYYVIGQIVNAFNVANSNKGVDGAQQQLQEPVFQSDENIQLIEKTAAWRQAYKAIREVMMEEGERNGPPNSAIHKNGGPIGRKEEIGRVFLDAHGKVISRGELVKLQGEAEELLEGVKRGEKKNDDVGEAPREEPGENRKKRMEIANEWKQKLEQFNGIKNKEEIPRTFLDKNGNPVDLLGHAGIVFRQLRQGETALEEIERPPIEESDEARRKRADLHREWENVLKNGEHREGQYGENDDGEGHKVMKFYKIFETNENGEKIGKIVGFKQLEAEARDALKKLALGMVRIEQLPTPPIPETESDFLARKNSIEKLEKIRARILEHERAKEAYFRAVNEEGEKPQNAAKREPATVLLAPLYVFRNEPIENGQLLGKIDQWLGQMAQGEVPEAIQHDSDLVRENVAEMGGRQKLLSAWMALLKKLDQQEDGGPAASNHDAKRGPLRKYGYPDGTSATGYAVVAPAKIRELANQALAKLIGGDAVLDENVTKLPEVIQGSVLRSASVFNGNQALGKVENVNKSPPNLLVPRLAHSSSKKLAFEVNKAAGHNQAANSAHGDNSESPIMSKSNEEEKQRRRTRINRKFGADPSKPAKTHALVPVANYIIGNGGRRLTVMDRERNE